MSYGEQTRSRHSSREKEVEGEGGAITEDGERTKTTKPGIMPSGRWRSPPGKHANLRRSCSAASKHEEERKKSKREKGRSK